MILSDFKLNQETVISTKNIIEDTFTDELIFGICSPLGTNKTPFLESLIKRLKETYNYEVRVIKLSADFIEQYGDKSLIKTKVSRTIPFQQMDDLIEMGDNIRSKYGHSVLIELAIEKIRFDREKEIKKDSKTTTEYQSRRICYIIDSLKNHEELNILRSVYRDNFYFFGVFSTLIERRKHLMGKYLAMNEIEMLIGKDNSTGVKYGQEVQKIFQKSDFFIRYESAENEEEDVSKKLNSNIERYLHLIFNSSIVTPSFHETAMYQAAAASRNSACLSRQVGACITDEFGEILSIGWNDVPKFGGGLYQSEEKDNRCAFWESSNKKVCHNDLNKDILSTEIVNTLISKNVIMEINKVAAIKTIREDSGISQLLEFSRAVHAEMQAIIIGSQQSGRKMKNGKLYTTTYPCHNCARHIIAAGIKEVYYIEPYAKSLSTILHSDAITESESKNIKDKVKILIFDGVSPNRYLEFFSIHTKRKINGEYIKLESKDLKTVSPIARMSINDIPALEAKILLQLKSKNLTNISDRGNG